MNRQSGAHHQYDYEDLPEGWQPPLTPPPQPAQHLPPPPPPAPVAGSKRSNEVGSNEPKNIKARRTDASTNAPPHKVSNTPSKGDGFSVTIRRRRHDDDDDDEEAGVPQSNVNKELPPAPQAQIETNAGSRHLDQQPPTIPDPPPEQDTGARKGKGKGKARQDDDLHDTRGDLARSTSNGSSETQHQAPSNTHSTARGNIECDGEQPPPSAMELDERGHRDGATSHRHLHEGHDMMGSNEQQPPSSPMQQDERHPRDGSTTPRQTQELDDDDVMKDSTTAAGDMADTAAAESSRGPAATSAAVDSDSRASHAPQHDQNPPSLPGTQPLPSQHLQQSQNPQVQHVQYPLHESNQHPPPPSQWLQQPSNAHHPQHVQYSQLQQNTLFPSVPPQYYQGSQDAPPSQYGQTIPGVGPAYSHQHPSPFQQAPPYTQPSPYGPQNVYTHAPYPQHAAVQPFSQYPQPRYPAQYYAPGVSPALPSGSYSSYNPSANATMPNFASPGITTAPGASDPLHPPQGSLTPQQSGPSGQRAGEDVAIGGNNAMDETSNTSDASNGRLIKKVPRRRTKKTSSGSQPALSRQSSLAEQFNCTPANVDTAQLPSIGSRQPSGSSNSAWPADPASNQTHGPQPSTEAPSTTPGHNEEVSSSKTQPTTAVTPPSSSSKDSEATTAMQTRMLQIMQEMDERSLQYLKYVKQNMQTREEADKLHAKVESLQEEIAGIHAAQTVFAATSRKRLSQESKRKRALMSTLEPPTASSSKGKQRATTVDFFDEDADEEDELMSEEDVKQPMSSSTNSGSPSRLAPNITELLETHGNVLRSSLRKHVKGMLRIKDYSTLVENFPPLTDEEIDAYNRNLPTAPRVDPKKLHVDFEHPWKQFAYNEEVADVIVTDYLCAVRSAEYPTVLVPKELLSKAAVHELLDAHMKTLRGYYNVGRKGTAEDVKQFCQQKKKANSKMGRRQTLYFSRVDALARRPGLKRILALMRMMKPRNMSEDEIVGPTHPPVYMLRFAEWQSDELRLCFHKVDELFRTDWENGTRSGNPPRTLKVDPMGATSRVQAPKGLPKNCYNPTWLKGLKKHQLAALCVQNKIVDLSIPADIDDQDDSDVEL